MNQYHSYKDSGIEWIGDIPTHWNILKIKNLFSFSKGSGVPKSEVSDFGHSSCILYGELYTKYKGLNLIPDTLSRTDLSKDSSVTSMGNEILIPSSTTTTGIDLCNCKTLNYEDVILGGDIIILRPEKQKISREFYSYFISTISKPQFEMEGRGVTIYHIYPKQIREMFVPNLPIDEQNQIVSFLDNKTQKIDNLIEKIEQKIKLLKEQRVSLINEVVSKGLNPNVEMKDSGIEWIGEIPSHWKMKRLKYLFDLVGGKDPKNVQDDNGEYPILGTGGEIDRSSDYLFDKKTILLGRKGTIDKPFLFNGPFWVSDVMYFTVPKTNMTSKYLLYLFKTFPFDLYVYGSTQPSMSRLDYEGHFFPVPPIEQQQEIKDYLDEETKIIDEIISKNEKKIELLNEYKQSLISEVVTGKKRVVS